MKTRRKKHYFERTEGSPEPVAVEIKRRARFSEVDAMAVVWNGRYPLYFEEASEELGRRCGLSYMDFYKAGIRAPVIEQHIDYFKPIFLDEEFTIRALLVWNEGSRMNTEYYIVKNDGSIAASGYSIQLFVDHETWEINIVSPGILERCRRRWKAGELK